MLLKSIDIQGFKTFPDKTTLSFNENMVAVVGPNGSGKSNVSDAIRWVLGEQSTRVLRCSKMEDVIFKGTTSRKALGYAEVTLNIDNRDRTLNFDSDTLSIARKYYRSGESEYLINKANVRLKDINELFMDTGLGRDGYSIIGQGKIDAIVAAKSDERREIFEEASGISRFRYRKEESERRLNKTEENLVRLRDILQELELRVEPLRVQSEKASQFIELDKEKKGLEIGIWVETIKKSEKVLKEYKEKNDIALAQHNSLLDKIDDINNKTELNRLKIAETNAKIDEVRNYTSTIDEDIIKTEGELSVFDNDTRHHNNNIKRVENEIESYRQTAKNLDEEIGKTRAFLIEKEELLARHNKEYLSVSDTLESMRKSSDGIVSEIDKISAKISENISIISEQKIKYSSFSSSITELENREENTANELLQSEKVIEDLSKEQEELSKAVSLITDKVTASENTLKGYAIRIESRTKKVEEKKAELDKTILDTREEERRVKLLQDLERNFEGFAYSVKIIMQEFSRGTIAGIHGPVSRIIRTEDRYSVAIETALGAAMQNIVVSTDRDAKIAINLLKRRDGGRATFLPISTIKGNIADVRNVRDIDGFVGIAVDLVSCDEQYNGIRNSLLGRTIIAEDLDCAVIIAKRCEHRYRVVSLDGQVVNAGGSLTGGSLNKNTGLLNRAAEIARIKEKAQEHRALAEKLNIEYRELTNELTQAQAEVDSIKIEISNLNEDKINMNAELNSVNRELENEKSVKIRLENDIKSSDSRKAGLMAEMQSINAKITELETVESELKEQAESLGTDKEERVKKLENLANSLQNIRFEILGAEKDKDNYSAIIKSLEERKADSEAVFARLNSEIEESNRLIVDIASKIQASNEKIVKLKDDKVNTQTKILDLQNHREELEKSFTTFRNDEKQLMNDKENTGKELARLGERIDNVQKEYDVLTSKLWDEYELTVKGASEQATPITDYNESLRKLTEVKSKIRSLGSVNLAAIEEYKEVNERYTFLSREVGDVEKSKDELTKLIAELTKNMREQFSVRFDEIARNFTTIFKELFGGGTANLSFTDSSDILNSGIEIKVHPPGKIVSHIEALSGGEKALVAISIYFAIMKVNPPPFCMLDEVEAALDDVNVRRFADYLHKMNRNTQFILITHRRGTMESADMLYGVTMQDDGISKLLALKNSEIEEKLGKIG